MMGSGSPGSASGRHSRPASSVRGGSAGRDYPRERRHSRRSSLEAPELSIPRGSDGSVAGSTYSTGSAEYDETGIRCDLRIAHSA